MNSYTKWAGRAPADVPAGTRSSNDGAGRLGRQIDHERIGARAYEIYESRNRRPGHADEDWLQAEAEYAVDRAKALAAVRSTAHVLQASRYPRWSASTLDTAAPQN